ncbi:MAG: hypothetical protein ACPG8W_03560 [Candidatus Promineifilaceae bacterium]
MTLFELLCPSAGLLFFGVALLLIAYDYARAEEIPYWFLWKKRYLKRDQIPALGLWLNIAAHAFVGLILVVLSILLLIDTS